MLKTAMKFLFAAHFVAASSAALSHGDRERTKKDGAVKKEQKEWGIAGDPKAVKRTIRTRMTDTMRFTPDMVTVNEGDTVRFVLRNEGKLMHEFVIGTKEVLDEHAALMIKFPGMEHDEPYMAHIPPGKTGQVIWTFNRAGDFAFACLIAGHFQAGMVGKVKVAARAANGAGPSGKGDAPSVHMSSVHMR